MVLLLEAAPMLAPALAQPLAAVGLELVAASVAPTDFAGVVAIIAEDGVTLPVGGPPRIVITDARASVAPPAVPITRPVRVATLVRLVLDVARGRVPQDFDLGGVLLDVDRRRLAAPDGGSQRLTEKEAAILRHLHAAGDAGVGRQALVTDIWHYRDAVETHTLQTHVYRLRRKLASLSASLAGRLETTAEGYRWRRPAGS
jgi:hypothetical protein